MVGIGGATGGRGTYGGADIVLWLPQDFSSVGSGQTENHAKARPAR